MAAGACGMTFVDTTQQIGIRAQAGIPGYSALPCRHNWKKENRVVLTGTKRWGAGTMNSGLPGRSARGLNLIIKVTLAVVPEETA